MTRDTGRAESMSPPPWLDDEPEILAMLNAFLDRLDRKPASERTRMPGIKISARTYPGLGRRDEAADRTWALIRSLEGVVFDIRLDRKRPVHEAEYIGSTLVVREAGEELIRAWLSRPRKKQYRQEWASAVDAFSHLFADQGVSLCFHPIKLPGKTAHEVVGAFARIARFETHHLTLRQLSARCFWGHSKALDAREDLVRQLYPALRIAPRPVLVHIHLPDKCEGVLFIENQDTYIQALAGSPVQTSHLALVYAAGFRGSAERIRRREGACLHYHDGDRDMLRQTFEAWWFEEAEPQWPLWFWGDLDYSGMAILKALRQRFGDVHAWPWGYGQLAKALQDGLGHDPDVGEKAEQRDPGKTGCEYADSELLPLIRSYGKFVDQELGYSDKTGCPGQDNPFC